MRFIIEQRRHVRVARPKRQASNPPPSSLDAIRPVNHAILIRGFNVERHFVIQLGAGEKAFLDLKVSSVGTILSTSVSTQALSAITRLCIGTPPLQNEEEHSTGLSSSSHRGLMRVQPRFGITIEHGDFQAILGGNGSEETRKQEDTLPIRSQWNRVMQAYHGIRFRWVPSRRKLIKRSTQTNHIFTRHSFWHHDTS
jgi:hypothetical protein